MAGTSAGDRGGEFARVSRSESNTYNSGKSDSKSPMKKGFMPGRSAKDPVNTSKGTKAP
jgi:hypothetical protein